MTESLIPASPQMLGLSFSVAAHYGCFTVRLKILSSSHLGDKKYEMVQKRAGFGLEEIGEIAASISQAEQLQNPSKQTSTHATSPIHTLGRIHYIISF